MGQKVLGKNSTIGVHVIFNNRELRIYKEREREKYTKNILGQYFCYSMFCLISQKALRKSKILEKKNTIGVNVIFNNHTYKLRCMSVCLSVCMLRLGKRLDGFAQFFFEVLVGVQGSVS